MKLVSLRQGWLAYSEPPSEHAFQLALATNALIEVRHRWFFESWPRGRLLRSWPETGFGEIRGGEAFDLLQLLNPGHSGTISTVHANSAAQGISRFTTCVLQSGVEIPYGAIKTNIADSLNVIIQIERRPGRRFVSEILEIRHYDLKRDEYDSVT